MRESSNISPGGKANPDQTERRSAADPERVKRALLSVYDKTGIVEFATGLSELGIELISTGGTAKLLRDLNLVVTDVTEITEWPEMMDGRVKTLHPRIHGGLLALRDSAMHLDICDEYSIPLIDLVVVNLYPFEQTIRKPGVTFEEAIEQIDIGGPAMLRSAAKNHTFVTVVCDPSNYPMVLNEMRTNDGNTLLQTRHKLAAAVFHHTSRYDMAIAEYLDGKNLRDAYSGVTGASDHKCPATFEE